MKKKILYVDNRSQYFVTNRLPLAVAVRDRLAEVHVTTISRREEDLGIIASNGLAFHKLRHNSTDRSILRPLIMGFELARLFQELKPNLIHTFTLKAMCVSSIASLFVRKATAVMTVTGLGYAFTSRALKARVLRTGVSMIMPPLLKRAGDGFICQNDDDLSYFCDRFRIAREQLHIIRGSGVDIRKYKAVPENIGVPVVMLASRMLGDKGVFEFVEAARQLKNDGVRARFVLVGDTDQERPDRISTSQLKEWHQSGVIEWHGYAQDMLDLFAKAHIVCLPSYGEGSPKVLIEAAACGRPIVTTNVPGCREIVQHEHSGLLVPPKDSRALAAALRTLIRDPELRVSMGQKGRALVEREYSVEKVIDHTFEIYERILGS